MALPALRVSNFAVRRRLIGHPLVRPLYTRPEASIARLESKSNHTSPNCAMASNSSDYHRLELAIAADPNDSRRVMPRVEPRHRRILDIGCGAGQTLIGSNLSRGIVAVGIDVDHSALVLGKGLSPSIHFVSGRGESLPFRNSFYDLV